MTDSNNVTQEEVLEMVLDVFAYSALAIKENKEPLKTQPIEITSSGSGEEKQYCVHLKKPKVEKGVLVFAANVSPASTKYLAFRKGKWVKNLKQAIDKFKESYCTDIDDSEYFSS